MQPAKTLRTLAKRIYLDQYSIRAVVECRGHKREKRFEFDTPLEQVKQWQLDTKAQLRKQHPPDAHSGGRLTFKAAIDLHLKGITIASWKARRSELRAWLRALPPRIHRRQITKRMAEGVIKKWHDAGVPAKTIVNRARSMSAMWHHLDGPEAWTPVDGIALPKPRTKPPAYVAPATIRAVERTLFAMETAKQIPPEWRARYMVLTACGARPVHVAMTKPEDVDLERRVWRITSAKDGNPINFALNDEQVAAWRRFIEVGKWGAWDASKYPRILRAAGWPAEIPPYAAKHSFGQDVIDAGVDREVLADAYGHTDVRTTRIYTGRARLNGAMAKVDGRLGYAAPQPPAPAPAAEPDAVVQAIEQLSPEDLGRVVEALQARIARAAGGRRR